MDISFDYKFIQSVGLTIISPLVAAYTAIIIARFHFEKENKNKYLLAKDKTATDIINSTCSMLINILEIVNIDSWIANGSASLEDSNILTRRQNALNNFHQATLNSYVQLGMLGLYFGTDIVESVSQFQSDLVEMVNSQNFDQFRDWDNFRRTRVLPVLERLHNELKETVFPKTKSFRISLD